MWLPRVTASCDDARAVTPAYEPPRDGVRIADRYTLSGPSRDRGLGEVWLARDDRTNRAERMVKFHGLGSASEADARALVTRLRENAATGFATVLDGGVWQGRLFLVHEPCAGRSLRHWIDGWHTTLTPPSPGVLKALFLALCSALHEAHGRGLAHERLNPRSVVITSVKSPRPLLVFDGGIASFLSGDDQALCVDYLAPEQVDRPKKVGAGDQKRADLFALVVILAELLTLRSTPKPGTRETWEHLIRNSPRKALAALVPRPEDTPEQVWLLFERLLFNRNDPEIASASKVRKAAREAWEAAGVRDESPESLREAPQPVAPPSGARASASPPRESAPSSARSENPSREPQPAAPSKAVVVQAFSVPASNRAPPPRDAPTPAAAPVVASTPTPIVQREAHRPAPPPAAPAQKTQDLGADTLLDFDDEESTNVAGHQSVRAIAPSAIVAMTKPKADPGGDTLPVDEAPAFDAPPQQAGRDETLHFDPPSTRPAAPSPANFIAEVSPSDAFAGMRPRGGDTLPVDHARSPLANASAAARPAPIAAHTLDGRVAQKPARHADDPHTIPIVPTSRAPSPQNPLMPSGYPNLPQNSPSDTLPIEQGAVPFKAIAPLPPPRAGASAASHRVSADRTEQLPARPDEPAWSNPRLIVAVIAAGVILGVGITLAIR